jgi:hypothetical protein
MRRPAEEVRRRGSHRSWGADYGEAKAEYDGIIAGLIVALARKAAPASLPDIEARLGRALEKREAFCRSVQTLVPTPRVGEKGWIEEAVKGAIGSLVDAVKVIWMRSRDDGRACAQDHRDAARGDDLAGVRLNQARAMNEGLFDRPVLVVDPGMHTAPIWCAAADRDGCWAVTGADDKTVRVWSLPDGALVRIRNSDEVCEKQRERSGTIR